MPRNARFADELVFPLFAHILPFFPPSQYAFLPCGVLSSHVTRPRQRQRPHTNKPYKQGLSAPEVLRRNKRLRVYAREVDREGLRIKLTCKRPRSLPRCGPASVLASDADTEDFDYDDTRAPLYADEDGWDRDDGEEDEDGVVDGEEEEDEFDDDYDDDEGEDWFYPDRGQVIPPPEVEIAAQ